MIFNELLFKFEVGIFDYIGIIVLVKVLDYVFVIGMENIVVYEYELILYVMQCLKEINGMCIFGEVEYKSSVIFFLVGNIYYLDMGMLFDCLGIVVCIGYYCVQFLMICMGIEGIVCVFFGLYNIKEEIDMLVVGIECVSRMF